MGVADHTEEVPGQSDAGLSDDSTVPPLSPENGDEQSESRLGASVSRLPGMFSSSHERKDIAVGLALSGQSLEEAILSLENFYAAKRKRIEEIYNPKLIEIDREINRTKEQIERKKALEGDCSTQVAALQTELTRLQSEIPMLESQRDDAWQQMLHHRLESGRKFFKDQEAYLQKDLVDNRQKVIEEVDAQIAIDQKLFDVQKANREINGAEFQRRVALCTEEKGKIEEQLNEAIKYTDNLKKIGVTRTSATFLFVAGFISLAGVGSVISSLLYERQPGEDVLSRIIQNIGKIVDGMVPARWSAWAAALKPFLFIALLLVFLALFYALVRIVDWLVQKFDKQNWRGESEDDQETGRPTQSGRTLHDQFTGFASSALGIRSQLSNFLPFDIERKDYTKLLASIPYLFLGGVIVFLFSSGGQLLSLTVAYVGVIFALLATSVSVLYVTKVIEPRWDEAGRIGTSNDQDKKRGFARYVRLNRELTVLFALMVASLVIAAFMPTQDQVWPYFTSHQMKLIVWGFVAAFMCLSSLALAYGIIQRGIFKDVDYLTRRRNDYRGLIERFSMQPVVGSGGYGKNYGSDIRSSSYFDLQHNLEEQRLWYEMNEVFADDFEFGENPPEDRSLRSLWFRIQPRSGKAKTPFVGLRLKKELSKEPRLIDFSMAPEETSVFLARRQEVQRHEQKKSEFHAESDRLTGIMNELRQELDGLTTKRFDFELEIARIKREFELELNSIIMTREKDLMLFRGSFAIGVVARNLLKNEGVLPGDASPTTRERKAPVKEEVAAENRL